MLYQLDITTLAARVRAKRAGRPLRALVKEIGNISPATLSRVEREKAPDLPVFLLLCNWLELPPWQVLRDLHHVEPELAHEATVAELTSVELFLGLTPTVAFHNPSGEDMAVAFHEALGKAEAQLDALFAIGNIHPY
jgi:hypothetical protein